MKADKKPSRLRGSIQIDSLVLSDLFFNYPHPTNDDQSILEDAIAFTETIGHSGDTDLIDALVADYRERL